MPIVPRVLVALDEDRIVPRNEERGGGVAREVVVDGEGRPLVRVANRRLGRRAPDPRRRRPAANQASLEDLIEMTLCADEDGDLEERRAVADRIAIARAGPLGVRAARGEPRRETG